MRKDIDNETILRMRTEGKSFKEIGEVFGVSKVAIYKRYKVMSTFTNKKNEVNKDNNEISHDIQNSDAIPKYDPNQRYLRKKDTGKILIWTPFLAERPDMEEFNPGLDLKAKI